MLVYPDADVSDPQVEESSEVEAIIEPESEQSSDSSDSGEEETSKSSIYPARNNSSSNEKKLPGSHSLRQIKNQRFLISMVHQIASKILF